MKIFRPRAGWDEIAARDTPAGGPLRGSADILSFRMGYIGPGRERAPEAAAQGAGKGETMDLTPCVPPCRGRKTKLQAVLEEFQEMDAQAVRVNWSNYRTPASASASLKCAIRRFGMEGTMDAFLWRGGVYLVKKR